MNRRLKVRIKGNNPDYFLKKIIRESISIYYISKSSKELFIIIDSSDYKTIKNMKTSYSISIVDRFGLERIVYLLKNYYFCVIGFIIFIGCLLFLNSIIFEVEVVHSNKVLKDNIYYELKKYGIDKYKFKKSFKNIELIKGKLLNNTNNNIEWLEIEDLGYKYVVKVEERKINTNNNTCYERHIVASKKAMILEIDAESGEVVKKKNDYVNKGEVIISGFIYNKDKIVSKRCSTGHVYGEVWYIVNVSLPKKYIEYFDGEDSTKTININWLNKKRLLFNNYKNYETKWSFSFNNNLLPIGISFGSYKKIIVNSKVYNYKTCDNEAISIATNKISQKLNNNSLILSKKVLKKVENNSRIDIEVFFKIREDITDYMDISSVNIDSINSEE